MGFSTCRPEATEGEELLTLILLQYDSAYSRKRLKLRGRTVDSIFSISEFDGSKIVIVKTFCMSECQLANHVAANLEALVEYFVE